jgi:hypothetical protein
VSLADTVIAGMQKKAMTARVNTSDKTFFNVSPPFSFNLADFHTFAEIFVKMPQKNSCGIRYLIPMPQQIVL